MRHTPEGMVPDVTCGGLRKVRNLCGPCRTPTVPITLSGWPVMSQPSDEHPLPGSARCRWSRRSAGAPEPDTSARQAPGRTPREHDTAARAVRRARAVDRASCLSPPPPPVPAAGEHRRRRTACGPVPALRPRKPPDRAPARPCRVSRRPRSWAGPPPCAPAGPRAGTQSFRSRSTDDRVTFVCRCSRPPGSMRRAGDHFRRNPHVLSPISDAPPARRPDPLPTSAASARRPARTAAR